MVSKTQELLPHLTERRRFTREEYYRAAEVGLFRPDERLELIEGDIIQVPPQLSPHATGVRKATIALDKAFPSGHDVRPQLPLTLGDYSEPEPDVAVVVGTVDDYVAAHPETAVLVVEVADSSLKLDRKIKAGLYARAGIPEYWIVNLVDRVLEVHRTPMQAAEQPLGHNYGAVISLSGDDFVTPLAAPSVRIPVKDLLP